MSGRLGAALCPSRLLARRDTAPGVRTATAGALAKSRMERMESRRAARVFTGREVPLRLLRALALGACADLGEKARLVRFTLVEAQASMARLAGDLAPWLRREGLLLDGPPGETDARKAVFGQAPHLAVLYGPTGAPEAAGLCAKAAARLEWAAVGAGLGACFAGEIVWAAAEPAMAAALAVPGGQTVFAALLLGYPSVPAADPGNPPATTILWI